jgi:hypothetical protein
MAILSFPRKVRVDISVWVLLTWFVVIHVFTTGLMMIPDTV